MPLVVPNYRGTISCVAESRREWLVLLSTSSASVLLGTIFGMDLDSGDAWVGGRRGWDGWDVDGTRTRERRLEMRVRLTLDPLCGS